MKEPSGEETNLHAVGLQLLAPLLGLFAAAVTDSDATVERLELFDSARKLAGRDVNRRRNPIARVRSGVADIDGESLALRQPKRELLRANLGSGARHHGLEQAQYPGLIERTDVVLNHPALGDHEQHRDRLRSEGLGDHRAAVDVDFDDFDLARQLFGDLCDDRLEIKSIGIDEVQWKWGHKYQTLVYQIDEGCKRLLWVGPDRTAKTLLRFFRFLGKERSAKLQFVCSDMWQAYLKVIAKKVPHALHVLDRFHVMQKMSKAIDKVRAEETRQMKKDGYEPLLTGSRWLLLKRPENLSEKQAVKLSQLLQYNLKSVRSHLMKEDFQLFWTYTYPAWAGKFLDAWCTRAMRSKIEPMKKMAKTLRNKRELLLNWFRADGRLSSGVVEGFNNKLKLITRKSYGFRTQEAYETAVYHNLGALPEPEFTHRFF